nr:PLP-dependent aspartate aminotransferase family protein [uncultured Rhodopila sp.]
MPSDDRRPASIAAQAAGDIEPVSGAIIPPIFPATTFERNGDLTYTRGYSYSRVANPTDASAAETLTQLERGAETLLFGSGMAAATTVFLALAPGAHVVVPQVMYWALRSWLAGFATQWGLRIDFADMSDAAAVQAAVRPGETRLVWAETPANPLWSVTDIAAVAAIAHQAGAVLAVDSTIATPVLSQPLALGADIVMHSATKYLNGHSDVLAGSLTTARQDALWDTVRAVRVQNGAVLGPFESWLLQRGLRTLFPRVLWQSASALELAQRLAAHRGVEAVLYPGLPGFPGHDLAKRQMQGGFGGMLSVRVKGGTEAAIAAAAKVRLWKRATSLGGVESLIEHRASVEGPASPIPGDLLRLSVGIEAVEDLWQDLDQAIGQT